MVVKNSKPFMQQYIAFYFLPLISLIQDTRLDVAIPQY